MAATATMAESNVVHGGARGPFDRQVKARASLRSQFAMPEIEKPWILAVLRCALTFLQVLESQDIACIGGVGRSNEGLAPSSDSSLANGMLAVR